MSKCKGEKYHDQVKRDKETNNGKRNTTLEVK